MASETSPSTWRETKGQQGQGTASTCFQNSAVRQEGMDGRKEDKKGSTSERTSVDGGVEASEGQSVNSSRARVLRTRQLPHVPFRVIWQPDVEPNDFKWDCKIETTGTRTLINTVNGLVLEMQRGNTPLTRGVNQCNKARGACTSLLFTQQETHTHTHLAAEDNAVHGREAENQATGRSRS